MARHSAYTSTNQVPAALKDPNISPLLKDKRVLDWGAGKYDTGGNYLLEECKAAGYLPYDPYNRPTVSNMASLRMFLRSEGDFAITCLNVLNVIQNKKERADLLEALAYLATAQPGVSTVIFQIYEGDKSKTPSTGKVTQNNQPLSYYLEEIASHFPVSKWNQYPHTGAKKNILVLMKKIV